MPAGAGVAVPASSSPAIRGHTWTDWPRVPGTRRRRVDDKTGPDDGSGMPPVKYPLPDPENGIRLETCYDVDELAALLGMSERTVRRRVAGRYWPHVRAKGGRVLFTREHVRAIVAAINETFDYPAHEPAGRHSD